MSQVEVETRFLAAVRRIRAGELQPEDAFANEADWSFEADTQRFRLDPVLVHWSVYDRRHDEWYDTGYGPGEALMVATSLRGGAVILPDAGATDAVRTVGDWCLVITGNRTLGVWRAAEVLSRADAGSLPADVRIWSGASSRWHTLDEFRQLPPAPAVDYLAFLPAPAPTVTAPQVKRDGKRFCAECGAQLQTGAKFCAACGQRVADTPNA